MERYMITKRNDSTIWLEHPLDCHYLVHIARKQVGDALVVCDQNACFVAVIKVLSTEKIECLMTQSTTKRAPSPRLYWGIPYLKGASYRALIVQLKAMDAGLVFPINCDHVQENTGPSAHNPNASLPVLTVPFESFEYVFVLAHHQSSMPLTRALDASKNLQSLLVLIGPEKGWSAYELAQFETYDNVAMVSLGLRVFRADTAALLTMGAIHDHRQRRAAL